MPPKRSKTVDLELLRRMPLPLEARRGKEGRGVVLAVGGSPQMPGAIVLTATAALRAGAGKLQIATSRSVTGFVGIGVPEAYVIALDETKSGGLPRSAVSAITTPAERADAVVLGPGMVDEDASAGPLADVLQTLRVRAVIDAAALAALRKRPRSARALAGRAVLTPHCGEMAMLLGCERERVEESMPDAASEAAARYGVVVALKDRDTHIADPDGARYCLRGGTVGLATSGSGDVLAGTIGGLLARGCSPLQAALWGVYVHASAGAALMQRTGVGFLARDLPGEIPGVLRRAGAPQDA